MAEPLDRLLDALSAGAPGGPPEPPRAFLEAVGRRRRRRRLAQAAVAGACAVAMAAALFAVATPRPRSTPDSRQAITIPTLAPSASSAIVLTRLNLRRDPDHLVLPDAGPAGQPEPVPPRPGLPCDPAEVERWFEQ